MPAYKGKAGLIAAHTVPLALKPVGITHTGAEAAAFYIIHTDTPPFSSYIANDNTIFNGYKGLTYLFISVGL